MIKVEAVIKQRLLYLVLLILQGHYEQAWRVL